jgi:hypothetical protein
VDSNREQDVTFEGLVPVLRPERTAQVAQERAPKAHKFGRQKLHERRMVLAMSACPLRPLRGARRRMEAADEDNEEGAQRGS